MITTQNLSYQYRNGKSLHFKDLSCNTGDDLLILGASGSGKTTLLHLLSGILQPGQGDIFLNGKKISEFTSKDRDIFRGNHMGMIFQRHYFLQGLTVFENLLAAQKLSGNQVNKSLLLELAEKLDIIGLAHQKPSSLSQGEQQRFSIARALANKPSWILADEPTSSLDDENCKKFLELIRLPLSHKPVSWIIASHDNRLKDHFQNIYKLETN